ncbi:MAG: class I SAM-dependent methyltransferase [Bdellovibrionales bacterium]|nr:class I SAM-dependent methyltransferase [Bdellovibrionales bacterium]
MNDKVTKIIPGDNVTADAYSSPAWWYDIRGFFILTFAYRDTLWSQANFFAQNISSLHMEAAIGTGSLSAMMLIYKNLFLRRGDYKFIGIDYAPEMLAGAVKKLRGKNVEISLGDLTKLLYPNDHFKSVNLANSFHAIKDIDKALKEIHRVLINGGTFRINVLLEPKTNGLLDKISKRINIWGQQKGILYRAYTEDETVQMLKKSGFDVFSSKAKGNALYVICAKQM